MKRLRPSSLVLLLLCLMYLITYLDRVNVSSAAEGFATEFGLSKTQIGFVFSAFAYFYLLFQVIGGWVSDRFGARRTLIVCGLVWTLATWLTGWAVGFASLLAARVLLGLGEGATFPAATAAMSRWVAKPRRGFAQGITHAAARVGNALAPPLVVAVMVGYGWRASFYACAIVSLIWVVLWALVFTESPKEHPRITPEELEFLPATRTGTVGIPWRRLAGRMAPVTVVYFCYGWTLWLFLSWIPQYFLHSHNLDLKKSAISSTAVFLAGVLGDTLGGVVTDALLRRSGNLRLARNRMVAVCMLLTIASLVPLAITHDLTVSVIGLSAGFFFLEMTIGPMWAIPMDIAPEYSGTASGMMNTGSALAAIISPVLAGMMIDRFGDWELPFEVTMVLLGLGVVLASRMQPELKFETAVAPDDRAATARS